MPRAAARELHPTQNSRRAAGTLTRYPLRSVLSRLKVAPALLVALVSLCALFGPLALVLGAVWLVGVFR